MNRMNCAYLPLLMNLSRPVHALNLESAMPASNIANVILFLASDQAKMINGATIPVDQGWSVV